MMGMKTGSVVLKNSNSIPSYQPRETEAQPPHKDACLNVSRDAVCYVLTEDDPDTDK